MVYCDHSTYYREEELPVCEPAWGGLLTGPSWNRFIVWWHRNYRTAGNYSADEKIERGYRITRYFEKETWDYVHSISHGCTKFVDPDADVNYRQLNYLILQTCLYYYHYDTRHWESPLLIALKNNDELPTTTEGKTIAEALPENTSNYDVIDNMGDFRMPNYPTMERLWNEIERSTTIDLTTQDLKATRDGLRAEDLRPKSARSRL